MAAATLQPGNAAEAAALLQQAAREGTRVVPCGARTRLGPLDRSEVAIALSSSALTDGFAHYAGDLVAALPAGLTLAEANARLATGGQWLPIDPLIGSETTIGGLVASADSGPRRHGYGGPRDLIIGIEVALTNGTVAHSGGRVVKNVAGYDLGRLFCGSRGSLGVITMVTFKVAPLPQASRTIVADYATTGDAARAALALARSPLTPTCVEVIAPVPRLLVRFESTSSSATRMGVAATALLADARQLTSVEGEAEAAIWDEHRARFAASPVLDKIVVLPADVPRVLDALAALGAGSSVSARPALGIIDIAGTARDLDALVRLATGCGGHVTTTRAHGAPAAAISGGSAAEVMDAVKGQFDPAGILPYPWRQR